jgi:catechol 2,3-dioxygenase-like lactoylglutathione lyase family enzyme
MKRFHVHLHVQDLAQSIGFYSKLFAAEPSRTEADYAKWMLEDPPINFAISTRGHAPGIDHLGIQTDNPDDLAELKARAEAADFALLDEGATTCCYAKSEKHWITDPQGIAWEHFHTLGSIPVFREQADDVAATSACCAPKAAPVAVAPAATADAAAGSCCTPKSTSATAPAAGPTMRGKPLGIAISASKSGGGCC